MPKRNILLIDKQVISDIRYFPLNIKMQNHPSLFFSDGKKSIDFVLVYKDSHMKEQNKMKLEYFLDSLLRTGLDFELEPFTEESSTIFVKVHAPKEIVIRYADICDIDLAFRSKDYRPTVSPPFRFMATPLTLPDPDDEVYRRAPESVSGQLPADVTSAEKIMVVHKILTRTKYGSRYADYGLRKLLKAKVFVDAFPLHEGPYLWTTSGPLTDRQLLAKFWGSPKCWYKEQPLKLIEKYYGTEVGFYFAWCGFYLKMLIPASILGAICTTYGTLTVLNTHLNAESVQICHSDVLMCPRCHYEHCKYEKLSNSCIQSYITYLHDNPGTMAFAIIISLWSTIFVELWQRTEAVLQIHWHVKSLEHDTSMRPEYVEAAKNKKYSPITHEFEPYLSKQSQVIRYTLALASVTLMLLIMVFAMFGVMVYRITVTLMLIRDSKDQIIQKNTQIIASVTGSLMSASFIIIFKQIYGKIALWLTYMENPRTLYEFDNSYIYKSYALAFTNHYSAVFYIAFFKGRFFTHPGDMALWSTFGGLGSDICGPTGCIMDLGVQLMSIMFVKIFVNNFVQLFVPFMIELFNRALHRIRNKDMPLYGKQYLMFPTDRYFLIDEYMDMVIQYGFIVFFIAGFPPAPLLALINNFIEIRVDAYKMTTSFRRPVPRRVTGLGAWFGILQGITYVGVVTNAVVIAFTSDFVSKTLYRHRVDSEGFINSSLSAFAINDFDVLQRSEVDSTICYYPGRRYPPDHPQKYETTTDYWFVLAIRFLVVVIFEHVIIWLKALLAYAIPDVPAHVTEELAIQERKNKEARMQVMNAEFMAQLRGIGFSSAAKPLDLN